MLVVNANFSYIIAVNPTNQPIIIKSRARVGTLLEIDIVNAWHTRLEEVKGAII
jgi:hypothetical protein